MRGTSAVMCILIHLALVPAQHIGHKAGEDKPVSISKLMCKRYAEAIDTCYFNGIGSSHGTPKEYPHMVFVGFGNASSIKWLCGGNLISDRFVLTAGHCAIGNPFKSVPRWVKVGDYDMESENDEKLGLGQPAVYEVTEVIPHPDYKPPRYYNDISLLKLNTSVEFNRFVRPICLQTEYDLPSQYVIATGYGRRESGGKRNTIMHQVNMTVVPWKRCNDGYRSHKRSLSRGIDDNSMVCAGQAPSGKDVCSMESGNPLQQALAEPPCMFNIVGIASFSTRCGGETPGVYSRVSQFSSWIEKIVWN